MCPATQAEFASALVDRSLPIPENLKSWAGPCSARRFGVYRGNVASALTEALAIRYPVVRRLVGDEFFRAMSRAYALAHLPVSPVLIDYGGDYPDFIAGFEPVRGLPYLADVARLESAHWEAYHAADAEPLTATAFAAIAPDRLGDTRFILLPSLRLVSSRFPVVAIWNTNTHDDIVKPLDPARAEDALVSRPDLDVEIRSLPAGAYVFLSRLRQGDTLAIAAACAFEADPRFDIADNLAGLMRSRVVVRIDS